MMGLTLPENYISDHDYYVWKNARIHFKYNSSEEGYCLYDADGEADDLFIPTTINGVTVKNLYGEEFYNGFSSFNKIIVSNRNQVFTTVDGVLFSHDGKKLILYPPQKKDVTYVVPSGVETICPRAFSSNKYLEQLEMQDGIISVEMYAFCWCKNIKTILIPRSVKEIGSKAFLGLDNLSSVLYAGSQNDWKKVFVSDDHNHSLHSAIKYNCFQELFFNSEIEM